jgi:hypothetical protein
MKTTYKLEFWADSFHEGDWTCKGLEKEFKLTTKEFLNGFIPRYTYEVTENVDLEITVYGAYKNWSPPPTPVSELLEWGKPDLIVYDPQSEKIILAIEETAAVPTGNQALQRCERIYGSARVLIPFWYLISEFGMHVDGGVRTDSIWPTILSLKLSCTKRNPSIVLHYADIDNPENYDMGEGMKELFFALAKEIKIWVGVEDEKTIQPLLERQYSQMLDFIKRQWKNILEYLPGEDELNDPSTAKRIAEFVVSEDEKSVISFKEFLTWGKTSTLPKKYFENIKPGGYIKKDKFVTELEKIVESKKAYNLSRNAGSKPQPVDDVKRWITQQKSLFSANITNAQFDLKIEDFPSSPTGLLHVTTAKNVLYLCDNWKDVYKALVTVYPRLSSLENNFKEDDAVLVYISNSMTPGRIFGDPFTGQLSAFSNIFARNLIGEKERVVLTYYPHQVHTQMFDKSSHLKKNKGITILKELADLAIFHSGVAVDFKDSKIV